MRTSSRLTLTTVFSLLLLFAVGFALIDFGRVPVHAAGASISLSLAYGPPTSSIVASGKGFKSREIVTLFFDTTQVSAATASTKGSISSTITVPASALPGNHFVQAKGKSSGLFAQAPFLVQTDWIQTGFNREHTGFNVFENVLNTTNVSGLTQSWVYPSAYNSNSMAIANGIVYTSCNGNALCALNAITGQLLWSHPIGNVSYSTPAVANGLVYIGSYNNSLYALNAATGQLTWSFATGSAIGGSPLVANGVVYVGSNDQTLYALNGVTGKVVWSYTTKGSITGSPGNDNGVVYVGSNDGTVYALKAQTGVLKWHYTTKGSITSTPAIANSVVYIGSNDGNLYALDEITGVLKWSKSILARSDPSVANGIIFIAAACNLDALNAVNGAMLWNFDTSNSGYCVDSTPTIANGVVYVGSSDSDPTDGLLFIFTATTGMSLNEISIDTGSVNDNPSQPVVVNGTVYCAASGGLYTYH